MDAFSVGIYSKNPTCMSAIVEGLRTYDQFRIISLFFDIPLSPITADILVLDITDDLQEAKQVLLITRQKKSFNKPLKILVIADNLETFNEIQDNQNHSILCGFITMENLADQIGTALQALVKGLKIFPADIKVNENKSEIINSEEAALNLPLSSREIQVLRKVAEGLPNKTIAADLGLSERTVKFHINNLFEKLDVHSRTEAAMAGARLGLILL